MEFFPSPLKLSSNLVITLRPASVGFLPQWRYIWRGQGGRGAVPLSHGTASLTPLPPKAPSLAASVPAGAPENPGSSPEKNILHLLYQLCCFPSGVSLCHLLTLPFLRVKNWRHFRSLKWFSSHFTKLPVLSEMKFPHPMISEFLSGDTYFD